MTHLAGVWWGEPAGRVCAAQCVVQGSGWVGVCVVRWLSLPGTLPLARAPRDAYANDQGAVASLVAVTARTNRQESVQDRAEWMPPVPDAQCRYVGEWVATKLRRRLTATLPNSRH